VRSTGRKRRNQVFTDHSFLKKGWGEVWNSSGRNASKHSAARQPVVARVQIWCWTSTLRRQSRQGWRVLRQQWTVVPAFVIEYSGTAPSAPPPAADESRLRTPYSGSGVAPWKTRCRLSNLYHSAVTIIPICGKTFVARGCNALLALTTLQPPRRNSRSREPDPC
jgi:hypothetical protein